MKHRGQRGEIMIESMIVILMTVLVLIFLIGVGFHFYLRWCVQTTASDTAYKIAQVYKIRDTDPITGYVDTTDIYNMKKTKYNDDLEEFNAERVQHYAVYRLSKLAFADPVGGVDTSMTVVKDDISRRHINVTVSARYKIPIASAFLNDLSYEYKASATAECLDLSRYINSVNFAKSQLSLSWLNSDILKMVNSWLDVFDND